MATEHTFSGGRLAALSAHQAAGESAAEEKTQASTCPAGSGGQDALDARPGGFRQQGELPLISRE